MSASTDKSPLPDYERPPVVETVLGVQFDHLPGFTNAHLGAFWKTLDPVGWPSVSDVPPVQPQFEQFTEAAKWVQGLRLQLTQVPATRLQITNRDGDRMIQVQNGRLHFNWLGEAGGNYPRYEAVREGFASAMQRFTEFIAQANVGEFRPNQWEVTYVNHISKGTVWNTPDDWEFFQPLRRVPTINIVSRCESSTGEWHFVIPEQRGRLHVQWLHGLKAGSEKQEKAGSEAQEMIMLTLTARGPVASNGDSVAVFDGLDLGRDVIVRSFASLMSKAANNYWGPKNADD